MPTRIFIPTPLRPYANKSAAVDVEGRTVGEVLENLTRRFDRLRTHLFNENGKLRSFVNVYLNDEDIRYLDNLNTAVKDGDELAIIPAVAGG